LRPHDVPGIYLAANKRKIQANAQKFLQKGQLDRALKEYQTLVKLDPRDSNARLKLGDIALRQGDKDVATDAYVKVAEQFMKDGFDAKAVAIYKQVGKIDAERLDIYEPLAELYQRLGLTSEALAALQTAADSYHKEGRKRDALELLRKMATLDPTNTTSRLKIADLLRQADMVTDALAEYDAVAEELGRQGAREELLGVYDRILELEPERTSAITAMAQIFVDQGMAERAEPFARKLVEVGPDLPEGHELLARIHTAMGREDAATETYRTLAEVYRRIGDDERATEITQRVFGSELADQAAELGDGRLGGDLSDLPSDEAAVAPNVDLMEQTLDLSGGVDAAFSADAEQLLAEASVYLRYGKTDRAVATLEGLLATEPDHRGALEKLGEAHAERGDKAKAVEIWSRAAQVARIEHDEAAFETLRARIESLDAEAAARMGDDETAGEVSAAAPEADDLGGADEDLERELALDDSGEPGDDGDELDDIDLEIDLSDESSRRDRRGDRAGARRRRGAGAEVPARCARRSRRVRWRRADDHPVLERRCHGLPGGAGRRAGDHRLGVVHHAPADRGGLGGGRLLLRPGSAGGGRSHLPPCGGSGAEPPASHASPGRDRAAARGRSGLDGRRGGRARRRRSVRRRGGPGRGGRRVR
jgi:tetratricopeptide (TPR) repeat protein